MRFYTEYKEFGKILNIKPLEQVLSNNKAFSFQTRLFFPFSSDTFMLKRILFFTLLMVNKKSNAFNFTALTLRVPRADDIGSLLNTN